MCLCVCVCVRACVCVCVCVRVEIRSFLIFANNSKQTKTNPEHSFGGICKWEKRVQNFSKKNSSRWWLQLVKVFNFQARSNLTENDIFGDFDYFVSNLK